MKTLFAFVVSFGVTYLCLPLCRWLAFRFNILDFPGGRKIHRIATPLLGGAAVYTGLVIAALFNLDKLYFFAPLLFGATLVFIVGLINDVKELSARVRLGCQALIALLIAESGMRISFLPASPWKHIAETLITIIWIIGVTNAYNYLDGLDGLAAGSAVINLFCFGAILYKTGQYPLGLLSLILMGACLGFLPHNFKKSKIFLGEAGSTLLGFTLASVALVGDWAKDDIVQISIPVLILGVPIFDMVFTTIMRIWEGKVKTILEWLHYGGKDHFHHYLVDLGFRPIGAVVFIYVLTFSLGLNAVMISKESAARAIVTLCQAAIVFGIIATLMVVGKRRHSGWEKEIKD